MATISQRLDWLEKKVQHKFAAIICTKEDAQAAYTQMMIGSAAQQESKFPDDPIGASRDYVQLMRRTT